MKTKAVRIRNVIFWAMIAIFVLLLTVIFSFSRICGIKLPPTTMLYLAGILLVLAAALVVMTIIVKESRIRKFFFLLTGASALGIPVCIVLHNLVYAFCIKFNCVYWKGDDEPVFFILALLVCPALFILGALGSIAMLIYGSLRKNAG